MNSYPGGHVDPLVLTIEHHVLLQFISCQSAIFFLMSARYSGTVLKPTLYPHLPLRYLARNRLQKSRLIVSIAASKFIAVWSVVLLQLVVL